MWTEKSHDCIPLHGEHRPAPDTNAGERGGRRRPGHAHIDHLKKKNAGRKHCPNSQKNTKVQKAQFCYELWNNTICGNLGKTEQSQSPDCLQPCETATCQGHKMAAVQSEARRFSPCPQKPPQARYIIITACAPFTSTVYL